jgi:hypothetical protein
MNNSAESKLQHISAQGKSQDDHMEVTELFEFAHHEKIIRGDVAVDTTSMGSHVRFRKKIKSVLWS